MGDPPPISSYSFRTLGVLRFAMKGPSHLWKGSWMISLSRKSPKRKGPTSSRLLGPPRFKRTTPVGPSWLGGGTSASIRSWSSAVVGMVSDSIMGRLYTSVACLIPAVHTCTPGMKRARDPVEYRVGGNWGGKVGPGDAGGIMLGRCIYRNVPNRWTSVRPRLGRLGGYTVVVFYFLHFSVSACLDGGPGIQFQAGSLELGISESGSIESLVDGNTGKEYLAPGVSAPVLTFQVGGRNVLPESAGFDDVRSLLTLTYEEGLEAQVKVEVNATHATLELVAVTDESKVDLAIWGPYPTTIRKIIGETVGVVRGEEFAVGIQALNPKTLGGYPWNENDAMPQLDIFESGDFSDLSEEGKRHVLYRVEAAKPDTFGSTLQAYTRNRSRERVIRNWGHERYTVPPFPDGGVVGSRIALFGCPVDQALASLGAIEVAEGLPHPLIDGEWGKTARSASAAYVILPFSEATVGEAVEITRRAGLRYLYHPEPFESWGHFRLGPDFPNGIEGLRNAVGVAEARGVRVGVHTLSNFITTNDPYVTPNPDPRLARVGNTVLTGDISETDTDVGIESPDFFNQFENNHLRAAVVGSEIIQYRAVSDTAPWYLLDVERGAFGTGASLHRAGDPLGKLADHAYRVFLTDAELGQEMAGRLADLFNQAGLRQISFDGLEGNRSTGMGNYGEILFTSAWFEALDEDIRDHFIADASRTSHYFWHIYTRMNWGEPWYAGFRESQTEYRLKNQAYFRRNMMPGMLGWFRMRPETSVEDIEWMLARSAAFDAGYAFVTSFEALENNGRSDEILALIGMWEEARMAGVFSSDQKARMEDISNEFQLEVSPGGGWILSQIHPTVVRYHTRDRQPGEPSGRIFSFENLGNEQPLRFILTAEDVAVDVVRLHLDGVDGIELPVGLGAGEVVVYSGGPVAQVFSPQWRALRTVPVMETELLISPGQHLLTLDADGMVGEGQVKMELRVWGEEERVGQ